MEPHRPAVAGYKHNRYIRNCMYAQQWWILLDNITVSWHNKCHCQQELYLLFSPPPRMFDWKFSSTNRLLSFDRTKHNQTFSKRSNDLMSSHLLSTHFLQKRRVIIALEDVTSIEITHIFLTGLHSCEPLNGLLSGGNRHCVFVSWQALMVKHLRNKNVAETITWRTMEGNNYKK